MTESVSVSRVQINNKPMHQTTRKKCVVGAKQTSMPDRPGTSNEAQGVSKKPLNMYVQLELVSGKAAGNSQVKCLCL